MQNIKSPDAALDHRLILTVDYRGRLGNHIRTREIDLTKEGEFNARALAGELIASIPASLVIAEEALGFTVEAGVQLTPDDAPTVVISSNDYLFFDTKDAAEQFAALIIAVLNRAQLCGLA